MKRFCIPIVCAALVAGSLFALLSGPAPDPSPVPPLPAADAALDVLPLRSADIYRLNQLLVFHDAEDADRLLVLDDGFMGGESTGRIVARDGHVLFEGDVRPVRSRGFVSLRSSMPRPVDLSAYTGLVAKVMGDGKSYDLTVRTTDEPGGAYWKVRLAPPAGEWVELAFPFGAFEPWRGGSPQPDAGPLRPESVTGLGFQTGVGESGPFRLRISEVAAWEPLLVKG